MYNLQKLANFKVSLKWNPQPHKTYEDKSDSPSTYGTPTIT